MWLQDVMDIPMVCHEPHITTKDDQFSHVWYHCKRRHRWVDIKVSTRNGRHDPKCPSARRFLMVQEDTGAPNEGAACVWIAANEAVGCTHVFLTMWRSSRRLVC
ncbi:uncharacterized protein TNCV_3670081 [Trichonephila clavipes]|nr:uncharacterized protein TNCV_3670081 [Trichonephila clavipes]